MEVLDQNKVLIIQTAFLGDAVLTLPMIQKLKEQEANLKITVLCIPSTKDLFEHSRFVDEVIAYDKRGKDKSFSSNLMLVKALRSRNFERVYSPHRSFRSTLISYLAGAKTTYGFDIASLSFLHSKLVRYESTIHEVARNLSLIGFDISNDKWKVKPELLIPNSVEKGNQDKLEELGGEKSIAVAPGSVWQTKVYPEKYFIELIKNLTEKKYFVLLIGGKEDKDLCERIETHFPSNVKSFAGDLSIIESISLLKRCLALVCNDSAPTHLAMIADIPALTVYCSTVPAFGFYPYNSKSEIISFDELTCKPCGIHGHKECPVNTFDCAYKLKPAMVLNKLWEIIPD